MLASPFSLSEKKITILSALSVAALAIGAIVYFQNTPRSASSSLSSADFSAARAMQNLQAITRSPHPIGSAAHTQAREYLVAQLKSIGLDPQVQESSAINSSRGVPLKAGTIRNVIAKIPGLRSAKSIALTGHYDTVPTSYGSNDDGSSVASILETLRALRSGPPLQNDIIGLFTDGEETGQLGAIAFLEQHPWAKDVGVVLNFEARGSKGPVVMFETSRDNGWLIREFAKSAPRPVANSLMGEIYRLLPNDTDLTIYKSKGIAGLNFAYVGGITQYHTALDRFENTSAENLAQQGAYALSLARQLGNLDLTQIKSPDKIYFDVLGFFLIHYSTWTAWVMIAITCSLFVGLLFFGLKTKSLRISRMLIGLILFPVSIFLTTKLVTMVWELIQKRSDVHDGVPWGDSYHTASYAIGFLCLSVFIVASLYAILQKKALATELAMGALGLWTTLMIVLSYYLPGASYLVTWPLFFSLLGLGAFLSRHNQPTKWKGAIAMWLCSIPVLMLLAPIISLLFDALTLTMIGPICGIIALSLGLLIPQLSLISPGKKWLPAAAALLLAIVFLGFAEFKSGFSRETPQSTLVFYYLDGDAPVGKNAWYFGGDDRWLVKAKNSEAEQVNLDEYYPFGYGSYLKLQAPAINAPPPIVTVLDRQAIDGKNSLDIRVASARSAPVMSVKFESAGDLNLLSINGKSIDGGESPDAASKQIGFRYYAVPDEGIVVRLLLSGQEPVKVLAVDQSYGLPDTFEESMLPAVDRLIPTPNPLSQSLLVRKSAVIEARSN